MSIEAFGCSQPTPAQSGAATAATLLVASSPVPKVVVGFVDVVSGDTVLVTAFITLPGVPVVIETRLAIEVRSASVTPPIDVGETLAHRVSRTPDHSSTAEDSDHSSTPYYEEPRKHTSLSSH